jgi:hypothetical protein
VGGLAIPLVSVIGPSLGTALGDRLGCWTGLELGTKLGKKEEKIIEWNYKRASNNRSMIGWVLPLPKIMCRMVLEDITGNMIDIRKDNWDKILIQLTQY